MPATRTFRFTITVTVDPERHGYDDPEWIADAARGSLTDEYGYARAFDDVEEVEEVDDAADGS